MRFTFFMRAILLGALLACIPFALAQNSSQAPSDPQQMPSSDASQQAPPDNTKVNKRDRSGHEATADQQKENASDRDLSRQIRKALTDDKSLSTYARNVKVIVQNGQVTLKGPVRSDDEKQKIESAATSIAGAGKVTNQIEVAPKQ
jgi:hyperosmotically inducible periplasmic protein